MTSKTPISPLASPADDGEMSDSDEALIKAVEAEDDKEDVANAETDDDNEGALIAKPLRKPGQPTDREKREHEVTHLPPRSWCPWCCFGRGISDHHSVKEKGTVGDVPTISIDYCFMGSSSVAASENPVLVAYDNSTSAVAAYLVGTKGPVEWVVKALCQDLEVWGYGGCRIAIKSDQENAIKSLREAIALRRSAPTAIIESPVRESKSNGQVEKAIQRWQGQYRTLRLSLQDKLGKSVPVKGRISAWLVQWSAVILNRYWVGSRGRTAFQLVNGHQCKRPVARFGESVQFMRSGTHVDKAESMWSSGIFLGMNAKSIDSIISTNEGICMARTVRAKPETEAWDIDAIAKIQSYVEFIGFPDDEHGFSMPGVGPAPATPDVPQDSQPTHAPSTPTQVDGGVQTSENVHVHVEDHRVMHSNDDRSPENQRASTDTEMDLERIQEPMTPQSAQQMDSPAPISYAPPSPGTMSNGSNIEWFQCHDVQDQ